MNIDELLLKHPLPWRMENGDMLDVNGLCVRPSYDIIASVAELGALRDNVSLTKDHVAYIELQLIGLQRAAAKIWMFIMPLEGSTNSMRLKK